MAFISALASLPQNVRTALQDLSRRIKGVEAPVFTPVTFDGTWVNYTPTVGGTHAQVSHARAGKHVFVQGLAYNGTDANRNTSITTLPSDRRPAASLVFSLAGATGAVRVDVNSAGQIIPILAPSGAAGFIGLNLDFWVP